MKNSLFIIFLILLFGCSGGYEVKQQTTYGLGKANIEVNDIYVWVDYMPGGKFNGILRLSGDLIIIESKEYDFTKLSLSKIKVSQNSILFYKITPQITNNLKYNKKNKKNILFTTIERLEVVPEFNQNDKIEIELVFVEEEKTFSTIIKNVKIEKTY